MTLTERSSLGAVAASVANALSRAGIRAVLSGGACASVHSGGVYQSVDLDFILQEYDSPQQVDDAMATVGFQRQGNQYFHRRVRFYVEFPPGPLSIGGDYRIQPVAISIRGKPVLALSATDSCRDRLAGYFHWNDREGLRAAVQIALGGNVELEKVRSWAESEGPFAVARHQTFLAEIDLARRRRRSRQKVRSRKKSKGRRG